MNPIEDQEAEQWLESLRDESRAADNLDRVLVERLRQSASTSRAKSEEDDVNISHLKEQFLFRLRKEGLASKTRLAPPKMKWVAMAAALVLAVLMVPEIANRYGTEFPSELGQPKSGDSIRYLQTGRKSFQANLARNNVKLVAREIGLVLEQHGVEYTETMEGLKRRLSFNIDKSQRPALNQALAPTGFQLPRAGSWTIELEER